MKKKAYLSIYALLVLLLFGLTISFIYEENQTNIETTRLLYDKKKAMYKAESLANIIIFDESLEVESLSESYGAYEPFYLNFNKDKLLLTVVFKENESRARAKIYFEKSEDGTYKIIKKTIY